MLQIQMMIWLFLPCVLIYVLLHRTDRKWILPVYYINLKRRVDRCETTARLLSEYPGQVRRIEAVDGRDFKDLTIFPGCEMVRKGQKGCFLSHINAWRLIANGHAVMSLVLEDDVDFDVVQFPAILSNIINAADRYGHWDIILLGYLDSVKEFFGATNVKISNDFRLGYLKDGYYLPSGMAYILKRSTARRMIENVNRGKGSCLPVDHYMSDRVHGNTIFTAIPSIVVHRDGPSDITSDD